MSKLRLSVNRLGLELLLAAALSLAGAALVFWGLHTAGWEALDRAVQSPAFITRQETATLGRLQRYVDEHRVRMADTDALNRWVSGERDMFLFLYRGNRLFYHSVDYYWDESSEKEYATPPEELGFPLYPVVFSDGTARAIISCFSQYRYYSLVNAACAAGALVFFVAALLLLIRQKTRYISQLEEELKILEGGDLAHPVTVRGRDELASLAMGIDAMRRAIVERQALEEQAQAANRSLITAISHDLRTPLTSLIGYLEILSARRCGSEEEQRFLETGRQKSYQIKELSDRLFEYFLVYGKCDELSLEDVSGAALAGQLEESLLDLESAGFLVERETDAPDCLLSADLGMLRRVFGNIFSNLAKYADPAEPIRAVCHREGDFLIFLFENRIGEHPARESTGIGLKTCEEILRRHGGDFTTAREDGRFRARLSLPLLYKSL